MKPEAPIAIVGYSHRLPGGLRTDDDFWRLLSEREIVREPVTDRYGRGYRPIGGSSGPGRFASPYEGLIRDDVEKLFDRGFFGLSHNEMLAMDPQVRMLAQCLEGNAQGPACIPTLMRDSDVCVGFQEALGALFRAGVDLDFDAQYPRPEPIAHRLPGHPREEQATIDVLCDNEMFVRQGQYSHGPLVGHYVDLVENPLAVVRGVYERFNWTLEQGTVAAMDEWLFRQAERRRQEKRHLYALEDYGLTPEAEDGAFAPYREFLTRSGIRQG